MSLTVETGSGSASADSYVSIADVTAYLTSMGAETAWVLLTTTQQEVACRKATRYIESAYRNRWRGVKASGTQALQWPRTGVIVDGYILSETSIPDLLKQAVSEAANRATTEDLLPDQDSPGGTILSESVKVGPVEQSITYSGATQKKTYRIIDGLLVSLLISSLSVERG